MNSTVIVAALGLLATVIAAGYTSHVQRASHRESRVFEARVASSGELISAVYDYERATYSRVKARLADEPEAVREGYRNDAWSSNSKARAAIGVVGLLSDSPDLHLQFDSVRDRIGNLNQVDDEAALKSQHESIYAELDRLVALAKADIAN